MLSNADGLRMLRNSAFEMLGNKRWKRVLLISFFIAVIWVFADLISGSFYFNFWHDLICIILGIVIERLLPWGKT